ncbi:MAG TPA: TrkH family potassium uptake protein [Acidobacteriota bacterium]|nr:TrkH family potassium uptake protein [Acidobacteriota bacterium]
MLSAFTGLIIAGTILLCLPFATVGAPLNLLDALFTATSAVCVTGLVVVDTATAFSAFGQIVILALIQLGGMGIITFSVMVVMLLGRRASLVQREVLQTQKVGAEVELEPLEIGKRILAFVAIAEFVGIILLALAFLRYFPVDIALYHAAFQSISAFCNAGFSTFTTNMTAFSGDAFVLVPMMLLIVLGGLGFVVVIDFESIFRRGQRTTLQTRIVLATTAVLLLFGAVIFLLFESENVLAGKPLGEKLLASAFHSVTCRTAGFNTVEYYDLSNATLLLTMLLMVIGGSPGSTAGGIKTTTAAIIFLTALARLSGKQEPRFGNRNITGRSVTDAITLTVIVVVFIICVTLLLQVSELGPTSHSERRGAFLELSFETVSAFGTVGLSMGATPSLSPAGKVIIILTMFIGRLGPLTFFTLLSAFLRAPRYRLYSESVMVG